MVMAALDAHIGIAEVSRNAGAYGYRTSCLDKARCLLDMQFQIRRNARRIEETRAVPERLRIATALGDVLRQRATGVDATDVQSAIRQHAECTAAADIGNLEPD